MAAKYIVNDLCVVANVHRPQKSTLIRIEPHERSELDSYLQGRNIRGLEYEQRGTRLIYIPYNVDNILIGKKEEFVATSEEKDCGNKRQISKPPRFLGPIGKSDLPAPHLEEAIKFDYSIHSQSDPSEGVPDAYRVQWLREHPDLIVTVMAIRSVTGSISDANLMFIILLFALLMIIFLASKSRNWLQYHS